MKKIPKPTLTSATELKPLDMNSIHFGGIHTPLTAEQLDALAHSATKPSK